MALTSQSEVPAVPPVCTNSLLHGGPSPPPLGEEPWKKDRKKKEDHCAERKRSKEETGQGEEESQELAVCPQVLEGKDRVWSTVPSPGPSTGLARSRRSVTGLAPDQAVVEEGEAQADSGGAGDFSESPWQTVFVPLH